MLTIGYEVFRALVELKVHEVEHKARTRHVAGAIQLDRPGWFLQQSRRLCGGLGTWLVALGRKLQTYHQPQALPLEQV